MGLIDRLLRRGPAEPERSAPLGLSWDEYVNYFTFAGNTYPLGARQTLLGDRETIESDFGGLVAGAYKRNGVVFACMLVRLLLFSEARFQFRRVRQGRPGELFGTDALSLLERPWPNGTTGDLLARAIQDADLAGNFFVARIGDRLRRLRPDWVTIILGSEDDVDVVSGDLDAEVVGYAYQPGGPGSGREPLILLPSQVAHFAPIPDPAASFRGMSWLTPIVREITADSAATSHKLEYFRNGATVNLVISLDPAIKREDFEFWVSRFREEHEGHLNAYRTLFLGAGAKVEPVGSSLEQADFKVVQGAGETRIAAAAGVPPVIVGLSEGLSAATYSNYAQARRRLADGTMRPLWRNFAGSLASIVDVPGGAELWYDDRDIPFLQEDQKDAADILSVQAAAIKLLTDAGFRPEAVVAAVAAGDLRLLEHTGLFSVQLQPAGSQNGGAPAPVTPPARDDDERLASAGRLLAELAK